MKPNAVTAAVHQAWREYDAAYPDRVGWPPADTTRVESYVAGNGVGELAAEVLDEGLIYLCNALVMHAAGYSVLIDYIDPPSAALVKFPPADSCNFNELEHEQGIGRIETPMLGAIVTRLRELEARLTDEYEQRRNLTPHNATPVTRDQAERLVLASLGPDQIGPSTIDELASVWHLTRAQASSAIMRLGDRVRRRDDGKYELTEAVSS